MTFSERMAESTARLVEHFGALDGGEEVQQCTVRRLSTLQDKLEGDVPALALVGAHSVGAYQLTVDGPNLQGLLVAGALLELNGQQLTTTGDVEVASGQLVVDVAEALAGAGADDDPVSLVQDWVEYSFRCTVRNFRLEDATQQPTIQAEDLTLLVVPSGTSWEYVPTDDDQLTLGGKAYDIQSVRRHDPTGVNPAGLLVHVRAG